jgi:putative addiction module antidote
MEKLKVTTVGASAGVILSKATLARMKVAKGDTLFMTEAPGGYRLTPYNPEFEAQMNAAEAIMREDREILRALSR